MFGLSTGGSRLRARDVDGDALRRALRAAIVVPIAGVVSYSVAGLSQTALFTLLGAIWLLGLVDFPGNRRVRASAYCGLGFNGAVLITIGTLVQSIPWLAVALTFVLGAAVTLAGVLSETIAAGRRVTLLLLVLPVCMPPAPVTARLLGWAIAFAICVPAALFLFPPRHHNDLRRHAAQVCTALADRLDGLGSRDEVSSAMRALEKNFMSADHRPVGLTAGSRALVRVVDDLKWLTDRVGNDEDVGLADMQAPVVAVLRCCARTLNAALVSRKAVEREELDARLSELRAVARGRYREDVVALFAAGDDQDAMVLVRESLRRRTIATSVDLIGRMIAAAAAADARPVWARVLGMRLPETGAADRLLPGNGGRQEDREGVPGHPLGGRTQRDSHRCGIGTGRSDHVGVPNPARNRGRARRDHGARQQRPHDRNEGGPGDDRHCDRRRSRCCADRDGWCATGGVVDADADSDLRGGLRPAGGLLHRGTGGSDDDGDDRLQPHRAYRLAGRAAADRRRRGRRGGRDHRGRLLGRAAPPPRCTG